MRLWLKFNLSVQVFVIIAAIILVYHNIYDAPFLWDDEVMIVGNPAIQKVDIKRIFTTGAFGDSLEHTSFYRPVQILSYAVDYHLWGFDTRGCHLVNILIHILGAVFLLLFLRNLSLPSIFAFVIALIYATHPIHIENVTYLSGRGDVLCNMLSIFSLFSLSQFLKSKWNVFWGVLGIVTYIFALFAKENTIFLPIIMLFLVIWKKDQLKNKLNIVYGTVGIFLMVMVAYIIFRYTLFADIQVKALSIIADQPLSIRLYTLPETILTYLRLLILPYHLHMEYHFIATSLFSIHTLLFILFLAFIVFIFIKKIIPRPELLFYVVWFVVGLLPVLNIGVPLPATLREHWVSFSSIAFFLFLGRCLYYQSLIHYKVIRIKPVQLLVFVWLIFISVSTFIRNNDWKDPFRLYEHDVKYEPDSFILWNNLGVEYFRKGIMNSAKRSFEKSRDVCPDPGYAPTYNNLGVIAQNEGDIEKAESHFLISIKLDDYVLAFQNIGRIYIVNKEFDRAVETMTQGLQFHPGNAEMLYYLGLGYFELNKYSDAQRVLTYLEQISPDYQYTRQVLNTINDL